MRSLDGSRKALNVESLARGPIMSLAKSNSCAKQQLDTARQAVWLIHPRHQPTNQPTNDIS